MPPATPEDRNVTLYPWYKLFQNLAFSQAIWFLYFQSVLTPAEAIMLYAVYDLATTVFEVPSGYASDRFGRRKTLIISGICSCAGAVLLGLGGGFMAFVAAQIFIGAGAAFASGTDSAFLYESLAASGREDEVEAQELRAWRFSFVALALSAVTGGALALYSQSATFFVTAIALAVAIAISYRFAEPPHNTSGNIRAGEITRFVSLRAAFANATLVWLFVLSLLMYIFSHLPYVFGQPFIQDALGTIGLAQDAPLISGAVTTTMMVLSVIASLFAVGLRQRFGLAAILLIAFGMQIALSGVVALTNAPIVIAVLLLRMVPDALSKPFIIARIQPELHDAARATYLSLQSFAGRLLFAATLFVASGSTDGADGMAFAEIQLILGSYVIIGVICLTGLAVFARRLPIETTQVSQTRP